MPATSQAQRGYLGVHFGSAWMRRHHFDNKGKLPKHSPGSKQSKARDRMIRQFQSKHSGRPQR